MHRFDHHHRRHAHWIEAARRGRWAGFLDEEFAGLGPRFGRQIGGEDLRLLILHLLESGPRHGYDLIKAIEELSEGAYSPSPGVIYPALTFLEEAGFTAGSAEANRKSYAITEAGLAHLEANRDSLKATLALLHRIARRHHAAREKIERRIVRLRRHLGEDVPDTEIPEVIPELNQARKALKSAIRSAMAEGPAAQRKAAEILKKAAREIGESEIDLG